MHRLFRAIAPRMHKYWSRQIPWPNIFWIPHNGLLKGALLNREFFSLYSIFHTCQKNWYRYVTFAKCVYVRLILINLGFQNCAQISHVDNFWSTSQLWGTSATILRVWRIVTNSSHMWRIGTNSSHMWRIGTNSSSMWKLEPIPFNVMNWYHFLLHVNNWYRFLLHVKNWYQFLTYEKNWYQFLEELVPNLYFRHVRNRYLILKNVTNLNYT